jgi:hypothetical protein
MFSVYLIIVYSSLHQEENWIFGVILRDGYSFFMADLSLNLFTEPCDMSEYYENSISAWIESWPEKKYVCHVHMAKQHLFLFFSAT